GRVIERIGLIAFAHLLRRKHPASVFSAPPSAHRQYSRDGLLVTPECKQQFASDPRARRGPRSCTSTRIRWSSRRKNVRPAPYAAGRYETKAAAETRAAQSFHRPGRCNRGRECSKYCSAHGHAPIPRAKSETEIY